MTHFYPNKFKDLQDSTPAQIRGKLAFMLCELQHIQRNFETLRQVPTIPLEQRHAKVPKLGLHRY